MKIISTAILSFVCFPVHSALTIKETDGHITVTNGTGHVLTYHKAEMEPPEGVSKIFRRSAFIHPLTAPNGGVVTSIHAPDHYHHMGLWHAWVKTKHKGRDIDFWNLKSGKATIRYAESKNIRQGETAVSFTVVQHHLILPDEIILKEDFTVSVTITANGDYGITHITEQENVSDAPLELPAYRYGGRLAYRGPLHWNNDNSTLLTSTGKTRKDGHESRADWCRFSGPTEQGPVSVTIMGHPTNHDAPQRQRIWPPNTHHGAVFYNFVPVQEHPWVIEPGKKYPMKYQIILSNGTPDKTTIRGWFQRFTK